MKTMEYQISLIVGRDQEKPCCTDDKEKLLNSASLSELDEIDSNFVTQSFAIVSYIFPMAKLQWGLAEVRVMSRLSAKGTVQVKG